MWINKKKLFFQLAGIIFSSSIRNGVYLLTGGILLFSQVMFAQGVFASSTLPELTLVNQARKLNGLPALQFSPILQKAANAHSKYLARNYTCSHYEDQNYQGFSGLVPEERALAAAYPLRKIIENVSCSSSAAWDESIAGLMGAIYHRLAFLSFNVDEIGFSSVKGLHYDSNPYKFTYMMGNSSLRELCEKVGQTKKLRLPEHNPPGSYWYNVCRQSEARIEDSLFKKAEQGLPGKSPHVVVYPWPEQKDVFPAFLDNEEPDPTPVLELSGIPVSVQFNPVHFKDLEIMAFVLRNEQGKSVDVWRLDALNDVHEKLSDYEYVWFPVRPLDWGVRYTAQVDFVANGQKYQKQWFFYTQNHPLKFVWPIDEKGQVILGAQGQRVAVQWKGMVNEMIENVTCRCYQCDPTIESFDTVSVLVESRDFTCEIKDKKGLRTSFTLQSL